MIVIPFALVFVVVVVIPIGFVIPVALVILIDGRKPNGSTRDGLLVSVRERPIHPISSSHFGLRLCGTQAPAASSVRLLSVERRLAALETSGGAPSDEPADTGAAEVWEPGASSGVLDRENRSASDRTCADTGRAPGGGWRSQGASPALRLGEALAWISSTEDP